MGIRTASAIALWLVPVLALGMGCHAGSEPQVASAQAAPEPAAPAAPSFQRTRKLIDAKTMSLRELVDRADRILVGRVDVVRVNEAELFEGARSTKTSVREVVIAVEQALKGRLEPGQAVRVRQLASMSAPLSEGETVMWFLPADSELGLVQPLGLYSGDFRVDVGDPTRPAVNLRHNEGLWADSLWVGDGFERSRVLREAAASLQLPAAARARIDAAGRREPQRAGVPLDLLVSATLSEVRR